MCLIEKDDFSEQLFGCSLIQLPFLENDNPFYFINNLFNASLRWTFVLTIILGKHFCLNGHFQQIIQQFKHIIEFDGFINVMNDTT